MKKPAAAGVLAAAALIVLSVSFAGCAATPSPAQTLDLDGLLAKTTDYQRTIIEDGVVTPAEYEKALLADRDCVERAGATADEITDIGNDEQGFDYEIIAPTQAEADAIGKRADACLPQYFSEVGKVWAFQHLLSAGERADLQPTVVKCLRSAGLSIPGDADLKKMTEIIYADQDSESAAQPCITKYIAFFSVPPADSGDEEK